MAAGIVAILEWRGAAALKENRRFLIRAEEQGRVAPRGWRRSATRLRSLTLRADGTCLLQGFSPAAAARRAGGTVVRATSGKARKTERG